MTSIGTYIGSVFSGKPLLAPVQGKGTAGTQEAAAKLQDTPYNRSISGQLVSRPNVDTRINFFVKDALGVMCYVGSSKVDKKGYFHFQYSWREGDLNSTHDLVLSAVEKRQPFAQHGLCGIKDKVVVDCKYMTYPASMVNFESGAFKVNYMNNDTDLEKLKKPTVNNTRKPCSDKKWCRNAIPDEIKHGFVKTLRNGLSEEEMLELYSGFGPEYPKTSLTTENLLNDLLNHICAVDFQIDGKFVYWEAYWRGYEFEHENSLPNVKVIGKFNDDNKLAIKGIAVWFPEFDKPIQVDLEGKAEPEKIRWALYVARSVFALKGEAELHLAEGHLLAVVPAHAFFKYIQPSNPIYGLLAPCLNHVEARDSDEVRNKIFGKESHCDISSLKKDSTVELILRALVNKADFLAYEPVQPLCDQHEIAKAEARHFYLLYTYFSQYLTTNWKDISKKENWLMIYKWSSCINKNFTAMPRFTENQENPTQEDCESLAQFLSWLVHKTTFRHWAIYISRQIKPGLPAPVMERKPVLDGNTLPKNVRLQNSLALILINFDANQFLKGPPGNIDAEQMQILQEEIEEVLKAV